MSENIGIKLVGGPEPFDGWSNVYLAEPLGGWPPPDEIVAFLVRGVIAVARPEQVPDGEVLDDPQRYRKVSQSRLSDEGIERAPSVLVRGARYEHVGAP